MTKIAFLISLPSMLAVGCASQLPTYPTSDPETSLHVVADRFRSMKTIQSDASVDFEESEGDSVRLDAALAAQPPDMFRLRAWKLDHAVFDATLRNDELWLLPPESEVSPDRQAETDAATRGVRRAFTFLTPALYENAVVDHERTTQDEIVATVAADTSQPVRCVIDRATLTPRHFESLSPDAGAALSIDLDDYRLVDAVPWPHVWIISHPRGRIVIHMHEVTLNADLPPTAFVPPRRAVRNP